MFVLLYRMLNFDLVLEKEGGQVLHLRLEIDQNPDQNARLVLSDQQVDHLLVHKGVTHHIDTLSGSPQILDDLLLGIFPFIWTEEQH